MSQDIRKRISEKVKELRMKKGLSKEELSLKLNLDNSYKSKLEHCRINISIDRLEQIADFFKISICDFFN